MSDGQTQDSQNPEEIPAIAGMPNPAHYDPKNPVPYQAPQLPEPEQPKPQPFESNVSPAVARPPSSTAGGIAMGLDSIFRGYMNGRAQGDAQKLMKQKKTYDDLKTANDAARDQFKAVYTEHGGDWNNPEVQKWKATVESTREKLVDYYGTIVNPPDKGKKKSSKNQGQDPHPIAQITSNDPAEKMQGLYAVLKQAGDPIFHQLPSPQAVQQGNQRQQVQQETTDLEAQHKNHVAQLTAQRDKLMSIPNRKPEEEAALKSINAELNPTPKSKDEMLDAANDIVAKHLKDGKPFTMAESQIIEAATGHKVTPRTITAKNPKTGEVAIATPNENGEYEWHTDKVFEQGSGGKGGGGGKSAKPIPDGIAVSIQSKKDKAVQVAMDKWKKGVDAKGLMIPGSHTFDDFVSDMQKAQNDYENSIRATGHTIEHVNVRDHLVMDGDHQGEWVDDNHNKAVVKDAMPKMTDTEVHEPEPKLPKEAVAKLQEGKKTRFNNGQWWTLVNGKPTQLQGQ